MSPATKPNQFVEVFRDDFEGSEINKDKWGFDLGRGPNNDGWGNGESQTYTDSPENAFVKDSILHVRAVKDTAGNWTSARLTTRGKFTFSYGKMEARVRVTEVDGPFSAVWALSEKCHDPTVGWPMCGEIDIFEMQTRWDYTPATLHFQNHHAGTALSFQNKLTHPQWHVYSMEWTPVNISFYHNEEKIGSYDKPSEPTQENWPYHEENPFYLIINNSMGSFWGTRPKDDLKEHILEVDYISVSKKGA